MSAATGDTESATDQADNDDMPSLPKAPRPRKFIFAAFRRGGSSIAFQIMQYLFGGYVAYDLVAECEQNGTYVLNIPKIRIEEAFETVSILGAFREIPNSLSEAFSYDICPIILVRDPRDCVVSWYYARQLHSDGPFPAEYDKNDSLDDYIRTGDAFLDSAVKVVDFAETHGGLVLRYEDMVTQPVEFVRKIIEYTGLNFTHNDLDMALMHAAFFQVFSKSGNHNRDGAPYANLRDLDPDLLGVLNDRYGALLERLGYPIDLPDDEKFHAEIDRREVDSVKRFLLGLAEENHYRINENAALVQQNHLRIEALANLEHQNQLRAEGIMALERQLTALTDQIASLGAAIADMRVQIEGLGRENGYRIGEAAVLREALTAIDRDAHARLAETSIASHFETIRAQLAMLTRSQENFSSQQEILRGERASLVEILAKLIPGESKRPQGAALRKTKKDVGRTRRPKP